MNTKIKTKIIITITIIALLIIFKLENINIFKLKSKINVEHIQKIVESFGIFGILAYILINCIRPLLFIPTTVMYISGGIIFGKIRGTIYTLIGLIGGSSIPFFLARKFRTLFKKILGKKYLNKINEMSNNNVIKGLFTIRVTPAFPFDIISYGAGISNIPYKEFLIGTLLGAFPKIVLYTLLGDQIDDIFSIQTLIIFITLLTLAALPYIIHDKFQIFNK